MLAHHGAALLGRSRTRREILRLFFGRPGVAAHVRELARRLRFSPQGVSRELRRLEAEGILASESIGPVRRYRVNESSPLVESVRQFVRRTVGAEPLLREALRDVAGIEEAFIYGSYPRGNERATSDVDLMVIGPVDRRKLFERIIDVERELGREVHPTLYSREHLARLRRARDPFIREVFGGPRAWLVQRKASRGT